MLREKKMEYSFIYIEMDDIFDVQFIYIILIIQSSISITAYSLELLTMSFQESSPTTDEVKVKHGYRFCLPGEKTGVDVKDRKSTRLNSSH